MNRIFLSVTLGLLMASASFAGDCCADVGCCDSPSCCAKSSHCNGCGKACQVVCEMKKVKKTVWEVECEEFCAPLPNCEKRCCHKGCGESCGGGCDEGGCCGDVCGSACRPVVPPKCGKVRCRKKLVKKEITCEVPVYKCVVCGSCCDRPQDCGVEEETYMEAPLAPAKVPSKAVSTMMIPTVGKSRR